MSGNPTEFDTMKRLAAAALAAYALSAAPALAQDVEKGKSQFGQCRACHSLDKGKNGVGPSLNGIFGRTAGTAERYSYSS
jgi:cytochrome c